MMPEASFGMAEKHAFGMTMHMPSVSLALGQTRRGPTVINGVLTD